MTLIKLCILRESQESIKITKLVKLNKPPSSFDTFINALPLFKPKRALFSISSVYCSNERISDLNTSIDNCIDNYVAIWLFDAAFPGGDGMRTSAPPEICILYPITLAGLWCIRRYWPSSTCLANAPLEGQLGMGAVESYFLIGSNTFFVIYSSYIHPS